MKLFWAGQMLGVIVVAAVAILAVAQTHSHRSAEVIHGADGDNTSTVSLLNAWLRAAFYALTSALTSRLASSSATSHEARQGDLMLESDRKSNYGGLVGLGLTYALSIVGEKIEVSR